MLGKSILHFSERWTVGRDIEIPINVLNVLDFDVISGKSNYFGNFILMVYFNT